ncbi:hypothetical protein [Variovorax paradoxus]|uniref:Uncharacterized protein n=1 Tax=Variovorax paradoxus TaxID=34073 RepID=A0A6I6H8M6_VARPD|nr:hypothetical protein [Variovorax paradoxus]QGW81939.1 hypothetical protein GOQ09_10195 [Variovorax paradoxus]
MDKRWCTACGCAFLARAQAPHQRYCAEPQCQRERRRLWQQTKRRSDLDYLQNQVQALRAWSKRNSAYWSAYRESHPEYAARNRINQRIRNAKRSTAGIAKMGASNGTPFFDDKLYELRPLEGLGFAKMVVDCSDHGACSPAPLTAPNFGDCKERT